MGDRIIALIKEAQLNVELLWPELFAKALANINIGNLQSRGWLPSSSSEAVPVGSPASSSTVSSPGEEKKVEAKTGRIWGI